MLLTIPTVSSTLHPARRFPLLLEFGTPTPSRRRRVSPPRYPRPRVVVCTPRRRCRTRVVCRLPFVVYRLMCGCVFCGYCVSRLRNKDAEMKILLTLTFTFRQTPWLPRCSCTPSPAFPSIGCCECVGLRCGGVRVPRPASFRRYGFALARARSCMCRLLDRGTVHPGKGWDWRFGVRKGVLTSLRVGIGVGSRWVVL